MLRVRVLFYWSVVGLWIMQAQAAVEEDLIKDLPGLTWQPKFKHYSGYLKATGTRKLHYWFVESSNDPKTDPVVLWLNGGPGCSSLDGLLSEHGPFKVADDGKSLLKNPYSWNMVANMLYMEAPAGVGYSYSDDKNYTTGDNQVAIDNHAALFDFFTHYKEYSSNPFFVTGESYGGIYVPTLSVLVAKDASFNFKGFAVGNGLSSMEMNQNSVIFYGYYHGLYGDDLWDKLLSSCCKEGVGHKDNCNFATSKDPKCQNAVNEARGIGNQLNVYNYLAECHTSGLRGGSDRRNTTRISPLAFLYPDFSESRQMLQRLQYAAENLNMRVELVPPCLNVTAITNYINLPAVRQAIHIPSGLAEWAICSGVVGASYKREYSTMKTQYLNVLSSGKYHILVYNGDIDMACNYLGDEWFVDSLKQKLKSPYKPWYYKSTVDLSQQVAGFIVQYENLSFVTIKGAGHMVPQDKPNQSLIMFTNFLNGKI